MILGHFSAGSLLRKASLSWDSVLDGVLSLPPQLRLGCILSPAKITPRMAEEQEEKPARVLGGITEQPTPPTPQPGQPLDSELHKLVNFLSVYLRMNQILFPFHQKQPGWCKKWNPNSGLSDDQVPIHPKSFLVWESVSLGIKSWRVSNSTAALALKSDLDKIPALPPIICMIAGKSPPFFTPIASSEKWE